MILWMLELFGLKRAVDPFFQKKDSQTIYAKIHAIHEPKVIMMFAGHNDSPQIFPFTAKFRRHGAQWITNVLIFAIIFLFFAIVRIVWSFITNNLFFPQITQGFIWIDYFGFVGIVASIPILVITQVMVSKKKSLGANDNLSGAVTALTLARYFSKHRPENVELWFAAFGSEEAGQRGLRFLSNSIKMSYLRKMRIL